MCLYTFSQEMDTNRHASMTPQRLGAATIYQCVLRGGLALVVGFEAFGCRDALPDASPCQVAGRHVALLSKGTTTHEFRDVRHAQHCRLLYYCRSQACIIVLLKWNQAAARLRGVRLGWVRVRASSVKASILANALLTASDVGNAFWISGCKTTTLLPCVNCL